MDNLVNILFKSIFHKICLGNLHLVVLSSRSLYGFSGECKETCKFISLLVTLGERRKQFTTMANFMVVENPVIYNAIFGRLLLNTFKIVVSIYHAIIKFPEEVIIVHGDLH